MQMAYPIPENKKRNRVKKTSCELDFNLTICEGLTFENGADVLPYGYGSGSVVLPQRQLHVEERHATKDGHQNVGNEESTCNRRHKRGDEGHDACWCRLVCQDKWRTIIKSRIMNSEGVEIYKLCLFLRFLPFYPAAKRFFFSFSARFS